MLVWKTPNLGSWIFNHIPKLRKCVGIELIPRSPHETLEESRLSVSIFPYVFQFQSFLFCSITWSSPFLFFFLSFFSFSFLFVLVIDSIVQTIDFYKMHCTVLSKQVGTIPLRSYRIQKVALVLNFHYTLTFWSCFPLFFYVFYVLEESDIKWKQNYIFSLIFNKSMLQNPNWANLKWVKYQISNHR